MKHWMFLLGVACAGVAGWALYSQEGSPDAAALREGAGEGSGQGLEGVQGALARVDHRLLRLELRERSRAAAADPATAPAAPITPLELESSQPPAAADEETDPFAREQEQEQEQEQEARSMDESMQRALADQAVDRVWEGESLRAAEALLERLQLVGSSLTSVECGSTLCRVSLHHEDEEAHHQFMRSSALLEPPFDTDLFGHHEPETGETRIYLARVGQGLPDVRMPENPEAPEG